MSNTPKTTKKIRRTKSINPSIPEPTEIKKAEKLPEFPAHTLKTQEAFSVIQDMGKLDIIRLCGVGVQDLGIIDPIDGWAYGVDDLYKRFTKVLFDEDRKVNKRFIAPALALEKNISTSEVPTMMTSLCMMAGVIAFAEQQ